ncbi:MAG: hypothetical protein RLZZ480_800, partial [Candidatus Parcubacteria bacterium]
MAAAAIRPFPFPVTTDMIRAYL